MIKLRSSLLPLRIRRYALILIAPFFLACLSACSSMHKSEDFERHRNSQIVLPHDRNDVFYFDVSFSPTMPNDNPDAEARRMAWLEAWMEVRKLCPNGYEIRDRRPFGFLEDNPARRDIRYEVACN